MPFSRCRRVITRALEFLDKGDRGTRQGPVQLLGPGVVRVTPGDDTRAAGAAGVRGQLGMLKAHSIPR